MKAAGKRPLAFAAGLLALAAAAGPALAHPGHPGYEELGAWAGLVHPFTGADHLLAMIAAGLWAARRGGRAMALWPATFLAAMTAGFVLGGANPVWLETAVLASVTVLGGLVALERRAPMAAELAIVGAAGALHGMAHAADVGAAGPGFELGMLAASALLQAAGIGLGLALRRVGRAELVRLIGAGVAACGFAMAVAG